MRAVLFGLEQGNVLRKQIDHVRVTFIAVLYYFKVHRYDYYVKLKFWYMHCLILRIKAARA